MNIATREMAVDPTKDGDVDPDRLKAIFEDGNSSDPEVPQEQEQEQEQELEQQSEEQQDEQQEEQSEPGPITADSLVEAFKKAGLIGQPQQQVQQQAPQKQLTQQEIDTLLQVPNVQELLTEIEASGDDPKKMGAAVMKALGAYDKHNKAVVRHLKEALEADYTGRIEPLAQVARQQEIREWRNGFFRDYPGAKSLPTEILNVAAQAAMQNAPAGGYSDIRAEQKAVAQVIETVMKKTNKNFSLKSKLLATGQTQTPNGSTGGHPRMSSLSAGGQGGAGGNPKSKKKSLAQSIWD